MKASIGYMLTALLIASSAGTAHAECEPPTKRVSCSTLERAKKYRQHFEQASELTGIPVAILMGVAATESNVTVYANSGKGDYGLMQVRCKAWKRYFSTDEFADDPRRISSCEDLYDPLKNILVGATILSIEYARVQAGPDRDLLALTSYKAGLTWKRRGISPQRGYANRVRVLGDWLAQHTGASSEI